MTNFQLKTNYSLKKKLLHWDLQTFYFTKEINTERKGDSTKYFSLIKMIHLRILNIPKHYGHFVGGKKTLLVGLCKKPEHIWEERISADEEWSTASWGHFLGWWLIWRLSCCQCYHPWAGVLRCIKKQTEQARRWPILQFLPQVPVLTSLNAGLWPETWKLQ